MGIVGNAYSGKSFLKEILVMIGVLFLVSIGKTMIANDIVFVAIMVGAVVISIVGLIVGGMLVLFYIAAVPVFFLLPRLLSINTTAGNLLYVGEVGEGLGINAIIVLVFILLGLVHIGGILIRRREDILYDYLSNPGAKLLLMLTIIIVLALIAQTAFTGQSADWVLRKGRNSFSYIFLTFLVWRMFRGEDDIWNVLTFSIVIFLIVFFLLVIFSRFYYPVSWRGIPRLSFGGIGSNSGAAYIGMHLPLLVLYAKYKRGIIGFVWTVLAISAFVVTILAVTRGVFLAYVVAFLAWSWMTRSGSTFVVVGVLVLTVAVFGLGKISKILFVDTVFSPESTFLDRVFGVWEPALLYIYHNKAALVYGVPERTFTDAFEVFMGLDKAGHNITLAYAVRFGTGAAVMWFALWMRLLFESFKSVRESESTSNERQVVMACALSLTIYFVAAHSATIDGLFYLTPAFVYIGILWRARSLMMNDGKPCSRNE